MDLEYTFWQMLDLCISPSRAYRITSWHKQTKNQWARDDPAFVAILIFFLAISSLAFSVAFRADSFLHMMSIMFSRIFIDFLSVGILVATFGWWISNNYLRIQAIHSVEQRVEWMYAFDIHCNSFFPLFLILYVLQFFFLPLLMSSSFFATLVSNSMYAFAFGYYLHVTFLGYNALPFLENNRTVFFLCPIAIIVLFYIFSILLNFNLCKYVMWFYFGKR
eukprot:TRINITY_DN16661_c0_g1_i1.p1 TRINITY_DN16661_c0_g1~~TRINITY_DN16661_c0_g1_i1.p1  ORF type:complete len:257 (+),score=18.92 TRINITY_DN16661_c0_g1_i1:114-773(+)